MSEFTYTVTGMTCSHCADSVTKEIGTLSGVEKVDVDVDSGRVTVSSAEPLNSDGIRAAVTEAGYELIAS